LQFKDVCQQDVMTGHYKQLFSEIFNGLIKTSIGTWCRCTSRNKDGHIRL